MAGSIFDRAKGLLGRQKPASGVADQPAPAPVKKPPAAHHAVSIVPGSRCCAAAKELEGKRFLSRDAPPLPLRDCDRPECSCRYAHHQDRRVGPRRAREMGVAIDGWTENDRRAETTRGRRKTDGK